MVTRPHETASIVVRSPGEVLPSPQQSHLLHPYGRASDPPEAARIYVSGHGVTLEDDQGRSYIDAFAGLWYLHVGYGRQEIVSAVADQMARLPAYPLWGTAATEPALALAAKLADIGPATVNNYFFVGSGSEAVETATKFARHYHKLRGRGSKYKVISRWRAFHGATAMATALTGITGDREEYEPVAGGVSHIEAPNPLGCRYGCGLGACQLKCAYELEEEILRQGPSTVAAFIAEPVMGKGGVIPPPDGYFDAVRAICDKYDVLLIVDETITAFGRCGWMVLSNRWSLQPDIITFAKGLTSGYVPLGAVGISERVMEPFRSGDVLIPHGHTWSGHAVACTAALANLRIIESDRLCDRSADLGRYLNERLTALARGVDFIAQVRWGFGLMHAVEFRGDEPPTGRSPAAHHLADQVWRGCLDRGIIVRALDADTIAIAPPLVISREEVDCVVDRFAEAASAVHAGASRLIDG